MEKRSKGDKQQPVIYPTPNRNINIILIRKGGEKTTVTTSKLERAR